MEKIKKRLPCIVIVSTSVILSIIFFLAEAFVFDNKIEWINRISPLRLIVYAVIIALLFVFYKKIKKYLEQSESFSKVKIKYFAVYLVSALFLFGYAYYSNRLLKVQFSSRVFICLLIVMLLLLICIVYIGNKTEKNILIIGTTVMSVFPIITPISHPLDEWGHFAEAVNISEGHIINMTTNSVMPTQLLDLFPKKSFIEFINDYQFNIDYSNMSALPSTIGHAPAGYPILLYIPTAIATFIGQHLNLSAMDFFYFGRFANMFFFVAIACVIIKILPFGKNIFALVIAMPQLVMLASSYSVDGVGNIMVMLFIALCLHYSYDKNELKVRDYILLFIVAVFLVIFKGAAYSPALFFVFLIPMKKIFKKDKIVFAAKIAIPLLIVLAVCFAFYKLYTLPLGLGDMRGGAVDEALQFRFIITHPLYVVAVIGNWYLKAGFPYLMGVMQDYFFGKGAILAIPLYILFIFTAVTDYNFGNEGIKKREKEKLLSAFFIVCVLGVVPLALYMQFNPVGASSINGMQFRYFIPVFVCVMLLLNSRKTENKIEHYNSTVSFCSAIILSLSSGFMLLTHCV